MRVVTTIACSFLLAACAATPAAPERGATYGDLLALHAEFVALAPPEVVDGVPDYSADAMDAQYAALRRLQARVDAIDSSGWPVAERVDHLLVTAEMRALEFQHRAVRPWARDPGFYSAISLGFGPKIHQALPVPSLPIDDERLDYVAMKLTAVPEVYEQARRNLTEPSADMARLAIKTKAVERNVMRRFATDVAEHHPELVAPAEAAADAAEAYLGWLNERLPRMTAPAGVGRDEYDWYLRHVLLLPYTFDEMKTIAEREYERSVVNLNIRRHMNRGVPMPAPAETFDEYDRRKYEAGEELLSWLREHGIVTLPEGLAPRRGAGPYQFPASRDPAARGAFEQPVERHFFRQVEDRDPMSLRGHDLPGHTLDVMMLRADGRPIRGRNSMYFINGPRMEGWAYYMEEVIMQGGLLDGRPRAREINHILQLKRAARVLPELMMHSNEWDFETALASMVDRTPWMEPGDAIALFDMELYLRQPGYGIGYLIGKVQFEELLARRAEQLGDDFDLAAFHDEFLAAGVIPTALIRWEMTGLDDQVRTMW